MSKSEQAKSFLNNLAASYVYARIAGGAGVVGLDTLAYQTGWHNFAHLHPVAAFLIGIGGGSVALSGVIGMFVRPKETTTPVLTAPKKAISMGGNSSGDQIVAKDSLVHTGDTNYYFPPVPLPSSPPQSPTPIPPKLKKPVLVIAEKCEPQFLKYDSNDAAWVADAHGKRMLVVPVVNPLPKNGEESIPAERISVHLRFSFESFFSMEIERAYWVGESSNEVEIETGKKKYVLIGSSKEDLWCSFENVHSFAQRSDWGHRTWRDDPTEKTIPFPPDSMIHFEVCVLYKGRNGAVSAIDRKQFALKVITGHNIYYCEVVTA